MTGRAVGAAQVRRQVMQLQKERRRLDDRVGSKADIVGSMIGVKLKKGVPTGELGMTYFVREKLGNAELPPRQRIPRTLEVDGTVWPTDVLPWVRMVEHGPAAPTIIFDGALQGTLTCFARSGGQFYGVSCGHCLCGVDGNPATPSAIQAYSRQRRQFLDIGTSTYAVYSPGTTIAGTSGYLDCGIFDLDDRELRDRAGRATPMRVVPDLRTMPNRRLFGVSTLNAGTSPSRSATVIGIDRDVLDERADLILQADPPGFFKGDSGMLWCTEDGRAVAIHARGELMPLSEGSVLISAMGAARAARVLEVEFLGG